MTGTTTLTEACETYASEHAAPSSRAHVAIRRAYMAGALEAARMKPHDVIRECLDFARDIGREVISSKSAAD